MEPIVIDAFENSDLLAAYDLTLVGTVLNADLQAHRVKALLALMPQAWQLEATGDEVAVSFKYDKLQKWCFICNRMSHDGKHCPELEKERAHVSKYGYKDRNLRQQDVLRGELSPYNAKQGRSSDKAAAETTKAWVVKSFDEKPATKETERKSNRDIKETEEKQRCFKPASWYRESNVEITKAASDPGKTTSRLSSDKHPLKLVAKGKINSSECSQVLVDPTDVEEVISLLKHLMHAKRSNDAGDERGKEENIKEPLSHL
ncbi:hypothetical protein Bca4012_025753 [Brassica carinata]